MPVFHPRFGLREVIPGYWYTSCQLDDLGHVWQQHNPNQRLYFSLESLHDLPGSLDIVTTTIAQCVSYTKRMPEEKRQVDLKLPCDMMYLISVEQMHWVSLAVRVSMARKHRLILQAGYADSDTSLDAVPEYIHDIMNDIIQALKEKLTGYKTITYKVDVVQKKWMKQGLADCGACGPYAFENACRYFNHDTSASPGSYTIREAQLKRMINSSAVHGCSTSVQVDAMILFWLSQQEHIDDMLCIDDIGIFNMIDWYSQREQQDKQPIIQYLRQEFALTERTDIFAFIVPYINRRLHELINMYQHHAIQIMLKNHHLLLQQAKHVDIYIDTIILYWLSIQKTFDDVHHINDKNIINMIDTYSHGYRQAQQKVIQFLKKAFSISEEDDHFFLTMVPHVQKRINMLLDIDLHDVVQVAFQCNSQLLQQYQNMEIREADKDDASILSCGDTATAKYVQTFASSFVLQVVSLMMSGGCIILGTLLLPPVAVIALHVITAYILSSISFTTGVGLFGFFSYHTYCSTSNGVVQRCID